MDISGSELAPANAILAQAAAALGLDADCTARLTVAGLSHLPSCFDVTGLAVASIGSAGLAVSALAGLLEHAGPPPAVTVDCHLANAWFRSSLRPLGWAPPAAWDAIAGDYLAADGWIRLHTNAPKHRAALLSVLNCEGEKSAVAVQVKRFSAALLEQAVVQAGGCAAAMRSADEWRVHPQGKAAAAEPLVAVERRTASRPLDWKASALRPLAGLRVLDLTRILAGPVATRFLAGYGADVLRIDPPGWDEPVLAPEVTLGKRCARLDLHRPKDRQLFETLLGQAHIIIHGYRPDALERLGFGEAARRAINPDLIDVSLSAYGWSGPWAGRRGFDSLVQMSTGIAEAGMRWGQADRPVPLPVQALDHATGYLMAAAAIAGLVARQRDGSVMRARLSLAKVGAALIAGGKVLRQPAFTGVTDDDFSPRVEHTQWGQARRLIPPLCVTGCAMRWDRPAPGLGTAEAGWF